MCVVPSFSRSVLPVGWNPDPAGPFGKCACVQARRQRLTVLRETAESLAHITGEADLAHFTVIDDVQADLYLLADTISDRVAHHTLQFRRVNAFATFSSKQQLAQPLWAGEAARMRRKDAGHDRHN